MPGLPAGQTVADGPIMVTSYAVQRWGCSYIATYTDSISGGLAPSEAPAAVAATVSHWGSKVTMQHPLAGWPDTADEFEARGPGTLHIRGRIATVNGRTYTWYVGCSEARWSVPWIRHYASRFIESFQPVP